MTISPFFLFPFLVIILVFCKSLFIQLYWVLVEAHRILLYHVRSFVAVHQRIHLQCGRSWFDSWVRKIPWKRDRLPTPVFLDFPGGSDSKESACKAGDLGSIPELGRSPGEGNSYPLQYSGLENPMDRGAWRATVHGVAKSRTRLNDFYFSLHRLSNCGAQAVSLPHVES